MTTALTTQEQLLTATGPYRISLLDVSRFALDGGAMFGPVPRPLWEKRIAPDQRNRIPLACRSIVIRATGENDAAIMIDVGMGSAWSDKELDIFAVAPLPLAHWPRLRAIILTHLHFDHAAGLVQKSESGYFTHAFPEVPVFLQEANLATAESPIRKESASYRPEFIKVVHAHNLNITRGTTEIFPLICAHQSNGHTRGLQWLTIGDTATTTGDLVIYPSDLIPTSHHLHPAYHTAYDICPQTGLAEKEEILDLASRSNALVVFQHDPQIAAARITRDGHGWFAIAPDTIIRHATLPLNRQENTKT